MYFCTLGSEYQIEYFLNSNRGNKSESIRICAENYNSHLPYSDGYNDYSKLQAYMKIYGIKTCWTGLEKVSYKRPRWINSTVVGRHFDMSKTKQHPLSGLNNVHLTIVTVIGSILL